MSIELFQNLDTMELQQLGISAAAAGESAQALSYLKAAAERSDASAMCYFMLGSEYAQSRLYEKAVEAMDAALALDPGFALARLQLGLLLLTMQRYERAAQVLHLLDELPEGRAIRCFGAGLRYLMSGDDALALREFRAGLNAGSGNGPLDNDFAMLLTKLQNIHDNASTEAAAADDQSALRHMLISTYTGGSH